MKAYLTLDYELFLGTRTGDVDSCLLQPMETLQQIAVENNIILNVFVDAAYLIRLRQLKSRYHKLQEDYDKVVENIKRIDKEGNYIHLHIHPQWLFSDFDGKNWLMDKNHYKLSDLPIKEQIKLITEGVKLLNSLITKPVSAFRAGGYSINNFSQLADVFFESGIRYDTSVLRGEKNKSRYQDYDYTKIPNVSSYSFDLSPIVPKTGRFVEYPISTIVVPAMKYIYLKKVRNHLINDASKMQWGNGIGIGYPGTFVEKLRMKALHLFGTKAIRASIDGLGGDNLERVFNYSINKYQGDSFVIIGHPKLITPYSLECLKDFANNHSEIDFLGIK